eukprot:COSAG02_NODE_25073_length_669_cov_1.610526_1_plen_86_part_10
MTQTHIYVCVISTGLLRSAGSAFTYVPGDKESYHELELLFFEINRRWCQAPAAAATLPKQQSHYASRSRSQSRGRGRASRTGRERR